MAISSPTSEADAPVSPTTPAPAPAPVPSAAAAAAKRKPSRRANTAERRATHNAVERQRRETLNGRFLDLAALLPNLSQIRRPSKSSIVNSSIAHIHASRRHRMLASRELRLLKLEADTFRRELNEWRERAGIPRIDDPVRTETFSMIISAELEVIVGVPGAGEGGDDDDDEPLSAGGYGGYVGGDGGSLPEDDYDMDANTGASPTVPEDPRVLAMLKHTHATQNPFAHGIGAPLPHILPRAAAAQGPPTNVPAFDGLYEQYPSHHVQMMPHQHQHQHQAYLQQQQQQQHHHQQREHHSREREREREMHIRERERAMQHEKMWGVYGARSAASASFPVSAQQQWPHPHQQQQMMIQAQRSLFTPPATSHGLPTPSPTGTHPAAGSPASSASGDDAAPPSSRSARRGSSSPSYELGMGMMGAEWVGVGMGMGGEFHGQGHAQGGVPRMGNGNGGIMGIEMPMMGVGVEMG